MGRPGALHWRHLSVLLACAVLVLATLASPSANANDLRDARRQQSELQKRLDAAAQQLADLEVALAEAEDERDGLLRRLDELGSEIASAEERVSDHVRSLYKRGHVDPLMALMSTGDAGEAMSRAAVVASLVRGDRAQAEAAGARRAEAEVLADRLEQREQELDELVGEQQAALARLETDLVAASRVVRQLEEEDRRRRAAEEARRQAQARAQAEAARARAPASAPAARAVPAASSGGYACPVAPPRSFTDTWGAPRSGGRRHRGTDIMAPRGAHIYAVTSGTVNLRGYGSSAGYWLILRGDNGHRYYYMHLQGYAIGNGARVSSGQLIGYNGDTGNARGTPHLHFELHPGGGSAVNPYPFLRQIC